MALAGCSRHLTAAAELTRAGQPTDRATDEDRALKQHDCRIAGRCSCRRCGGSADNLATVIGKLEANGDLGLTQNQHPGVLVMELAGDWYRCDAANLLPPRGRWSIFIQWEMSSDIVAIRRMP